MSDAKEGLVSELHRPARRNYPRRKVRTDGIDDLWQIDLVSMIPYASANSGYKYLLVVIDTFSKFAWAVGIKSKNMEDVTLAMSQIFRTSKRVPRFIHADLGSEFYNRRFKNLLQKHSIRMYSTYSGTKASIVERFGFADSCVQFFTGHRF